MAIIFDKPFPATEPQENRKVFSAYSNFIIKFHSDSGKTAKYATIGNDIKIYPVYNNFEYNLKDYFRYRRQTQPVDKRNPFKDSKPIVFGTTVSDYIFGGSGIYFAIKIHFTDNSFETYNINWVILGTWIATKENKMPYYFPIGEDKTPIVFGGDKIPIFQGFPFDVTATNATFEKDGHSYNCRLSPKRIYLSAGNNVVSNDPLEWTNTEKQGEFLVKLRECDGIQLKWLSQNTWKYWVFSPKKKVAITTKDKGSFINDFVDDTENLHPNIHIGKSAEKITTLKTSSLERWEIDYISDIVLSPKVYMYLGSKGDAGNINKYVEVGLKTNSLVVEDEGKNLFGVTLTIEQKLKTIY